MSKFGEMWRRVGILLRREESAQELDEEMRLHREMKERELTAGGMEAREAQYAAARAFGNATALSERGREAWGWRWLGELTQDLGFGLRMLRRNPGFAASAVLTLALGIGANTTMFTVVNAVLLRPLKFPDSNQLVLIHGRTPQVPRTGISYPDLEDWRRQSGSLAEISAWMSQSVNLTGLERPERVRGGFVSADFFELLRVRPELGRGFLPAEDVGHAAHVAIVNYSLWQNQFGGDPQFVGKPLILNGDVFTVVGILPEDFEFPLALSTDHIEIWLPADSYPDFSRERSAMRFIAIARMKPGVTLAQAQADMGTIAKRLAKEYPDQDGQRGTVVHPLQEIVVEDLRPLLQVLMAAVGLVLLIACANVANLLLARGAARAKEVALRAALGASRGRLLRQMLAETMVLWLAGGALGLLLGIAGLRALLATTPVEIPPGMTVGLSGSVLLFLLGVTALSGIFSGMVPALQSSRGDLGATLKEGGRTTGGGAGPARLRGWLLISQVALSMVLLVASGLMIQTILRLTGVHPGFSPKNLLTLEYRLPETQYPDPHRQWSFHQRVREQVSQLPGVKSVSIAIGIPFTGNYGTEPVVLLDRATPPPGQEPVAETNVADSHFFETLGIPLIAGRTFLESDQQETPLVAVISETMARKYWPDSDPLGRQIEYLDDKKPATIVGVVGDAKVTGLDEKPIGQVYLAYAQSPDRFATLIVRTESDPMSFANAVRQALWSVDKDQPMWKVHSMDWNMERSVGNRRYLAYLLSGYAALALLLAAVGTYGVLSYSVNRRVREIGVRMALGAQAGDALKLVIRDGMKKVAAGMALGFAGSLGLTGLMAGLLYGVEPRDPTTLVSVSVVLALAGFLACWIPARRATKVDPVTALRCE